MNLRHGSLFSGIGGFDLASEWMGWENVFHCEWNDFGKKILKYYWPNATSYDDITKTDFTIHRGKIDILTGGFPCQPYSTAGKRKGKEDDRHLWPEMLRAIREIQPKWVVGENVLGLVNWNGGLVFDEVQADLEAEGYEVQPYVLPAVSVNAPHRRDRVWFVAFNTKCKPTGGYGPGKGKRTGMEMEGNELGRCQWSEETNNLKPSNNDGNDTNSNSSGLQTERTEQQTARIKQHGELYGNATNTDNQRQQKFNNAGQPKEPRRFNGIFPPPENWENFPTQSPVCDGNDGISSNTHIKTISKERNSMDRNIVTQKCLEEGRLVVDLEEGKIYSLKQRGKEGKKIELLGCDCNGYTVHGIRYNGFKIQLRAHQIVWISANGVYDKSKLMIDHINRNKKDNRLKNLRLVDAQGNRDNATPYNGKLTEAQKDMMTWLNKENCIPMRELAEDYGISKSRVQQIISEHNGIYGITFPKWRNESIKAGGNAIVPQVALNIFKTIKEYEKTTTDEN